MARRRASTYMQEAAVALAAAAAATDDGTELDVEAAEISQDVLEGLRRLDQGGNRVTWYVYSDTPGKKGDSEGYIEKLRTEHLDEQRFKTRYGPGEFRVLGRTSDGHYVKGSHTVIKISDIGVDPPAAASSSTDAATLLRELRAADEARAKARDETLKSYATILAPTLATLGAALISRRPSIDIAALITALRPTQTAPTLTDLTTALANLKTVQGNESGDGKVELVLKLLDRLQDLPQGQSEGGWLGFLRDLMKEAAPHATRMLERIQTPAGQLPPGSTSGPPFGPGVNPALARPSGANGATPQTAPPSAPSQPLPSSQPAAAQPTDEADAMWKMAEPWLRRKAEDLHESAASNMDVEICAEHLLHSAEKRFGVFVTPQALHALLSRPDWWEHVTAFHPPLAPYQAWVDDVRRELIAMLEEQLTGSPPANPETDQGTTQ